MAPELEQAAIQQGAPVKVWGIGSDGKPFNVNVVANELSFHGARLDGIDCIKAAGDAIWVQYESQKARFRVIWVSKSSPKSQVGIRPVEPDKCIWPEQLWAVKRDESYIGVLTSSDTPQRERRQYVRYRSAGDVGFRAPGAERYIWGKLGEISLGGCYVEVSTPVAVGTVLEISLRVGDKEMAFNGEVRMSVASLGMGLEFVAFHGDAREELKQVLQKLSPLRLGRTQPVKLGPAAAQSKPPAPVAVAEPPENVSLRPAVEREAKVQEVLTRNLPTSTPGQPSSSSPQGAPDSAKLLSLLRVFFSENDILTRDSFKRLLEQSKKT